MTRADRLNALCARVSPHARYDIRTAADGSKQIRVTDPETGDRIGARGATLDAALDALEQRLPAPPVEA